MNSMGHVRTIHRACRITVGSERRHAEVVALTATPGGYLAFMVVNAVVWPGFALAYWYLVQREEESLMEAMAKEAEAMEGEDESVEPERETPGIAEG